MNNYICLGDYELERIEFICDDKIIGLHFTNGVTATLYSNTFIKLKDKYNRLPSMTICDIRTYCIVKDYINTKIEKIMKELDN